MLGVMESVAESWRMALASGRGVQGSDGSRVCMQVNAFGSPSVT